ncbi:Rpr2-domain-containing protein [Auricularia subglabra TFB-10046 SS5]|nr:Rpr2-domain-containing protein [Auricularia subglabra TFB-10046 SS5]
MARKQRQGAGGEDAQAQVVQNRDTLQRLNFLLQASTYLASAPAPTTAPDPAPSDNRKRARNASRRRRTLNLHDLSRAYAQDIRAVGSRTVTRIDPAVKRAICKGCGTVLIPGSTSQVRILPSSTHRHVTRTKCTACGATRVIPCPPQEPDGSSALLGDTAKADTEYDQEGNARQKRERVKGKIPFHERPEHIVFRGRERLPQAHVESQADADPQSSH